MNLEKQKIVMSILETNIYDVDYDNGLVYANRKRGRIQLKPNTLPSRYQQIVLFKGRNTGINVTCYLHEVIYMSRHGIFDPEFEIDHEDRDRTNNKGDNLIAKSCKHNIANSDRSYYPTELKLIRAPEIASIRQLLTQGYSQASIAKQLGLERLSVRYIIKRIEAGLPLKYE